MRRRLLLLAGILLLAWAVVQFWPFGSSDDPVTTSTVSTPGTGSTATPSATPIDASTTVRLEGSAKTCDTEKVLLSPSVTSPQHARSAVAIDIAVTTSSSKPCLLKSKDFDPIAVIQEDSKDVWDSSVCGKRMLPKELRITPGWATTVRSTWTPRKSGKKCDNDEDWLSDGTYTLRLGMLGGEPGKATFTLSKPKPKPEKPKDEKSDKKGEKPSDEPSAKKDNR